MLGGYSIGAKEAHSMTTRGEDSIPMLPSLSFLFIIGTGPPPGSLGGLFGGFLLILSPLRLLQSHSSPGVAGNVVRHMPRRGGIGFYSYLAPPCKSPGVGRDPIPGVPHGSLCYASTVGDVGCHTPHRAIGGVRDDNGLHNNNYTNNTNNNALMPDTLRPF